MADASLDPIKQRLYGIEPYHPVEAETFSDWTVEAGDMVTFRRGENEEYASPVHTARMVWKGAPQVSLNSTGNKEREAVAKVSKKKYRGGGGAMRNEQWLHHEFYSEDGYLHSELTMTESILRSEFTTAYGMLNTVIQQTQSAVTIEATNRERADMEMRGQLNVQADQVSLLVTAQDTRAIVTFPNTQAFPQTGDPNIIYYSLSNKKYYEWKNSQYVQMTPNNKVNRGGIISAINDDSTITTQILGSKVYIGDVTSDDLDTWAADAYYGSGVFAKFLTVRRLTADEINTLLLNVSDELVVNGSIECTGLSAPDGSVSCDEVTANSFTIDGDVFLKLSDVSVTSSTPVMTITRLDGTTVTITKSNDGKKLTFKDGEVSFDFEKATPISSLTGTWSGQRVIVTTDPSTGYEYEVGFNNQAYNQNIDILNDNSEEVTIQDATHLKLPIKAVSVTYSGGEPTYTTRYTKNLYVPVPLQERTGTGGTTKITSNGPYTPDEGYIGFSKVVVDVSGSTVISGLQGTWSSSTTKGVLTIKTNPDTGYTFKVGFNGNYDANLNVLPNGAATATSTPGTISVPVKVCHVDTSSPYTEYRKYRTTIQTTVPLDTLTATANDTYTPGSSYVGFSSVVVDVPASAVVTKLNGTWSSNVLTVKTNPDSNKTYTVGFGGQYGAHDTEFAVVSNGTPTVASATSLNIPVRVETLNNTGSPTSRYTKNITASVSSLLQEKSGSSKVIANGTYTPDANHIGLSSVVVDVPASAVVTKLKGTWGSDNSLTVNTDPNSGKTYTIGFGGYYGDHDTEFSVVSNGTPTVASATSLSIPVRVENLNSTGSPTSRYTKSITANVSSLLQAKTGTSKVTANGTFGPDTGYIGLSSIVVDVPASAVVTKLNGTWSSSTTKGVLTIKTNPDSNKTYTVGFGGQYGAHDTEFAVVSNGTPTVASATSLNIPVRVETLNNTGSPSSRYTKNITASVSSILQAKTGTSKVTENGTYGPDNGYIGLSSIEVDIPLTTKTIYPTNKVQADITPDGNYEGFSSVTVGKVVTSSTLNESNVVYGKRITVGSEAGDFIDFTGSYKPAITGDSIDQYVEKKTGTITAGVSSATFTLTPGTHHPSSLSNANVPAVTLNVGGTIIGRANIPLTLVAGDLTAGSRTITVNLNNSPTNVSTTLTDYSSGARMAGNSAWLYPYDGSAASGEETLQFGKRYSIVYTGGDGNPVYRDNMTWYVPNLTASGWDLGNVIGDYSYKPSVTVGGKSFTSTESLSATGAYVNGWSKGLESVEVYQTPSGDIGYGTTYTFKAKAYSSNSAPQKTDITGATISITTPTGESMFNEGQNYVAPFVSSSKVISGHDSTYFDGKISSITENGTYYICARGRLFNNGSPYYYQYINNEFTGAALTVNVSGGSTPSYTVTTSGVGTFPTSTSPSDALKNWYPQYVSGVGNSQQQTYRYIKFKVDNKQRSFYF